MRVGRAIPAGGLPGRPEFLHEARAGLFVAEVAVELVGVLALVIARDLEDSASSIGKPLFRSGYQRATNSLSAVGFINNERRDTRQRFGPVKNPRLVHRCHSRKASVRTSGNKRRISFCL